MECPKCHKNIGPRSLKHSCGWIKTGPIAAEKAKAKTKSKPSTVRVVAASPYGKPTTIPEFMAAATSKFSQALELMKAGSFDLEHVQQWLNLAGQIGGIDKMKHVEVVARAVHAAEAQAHAEGPATLPMTPAVAAAT